MNVEIKNKILEVLSKEGGYFGLSAQSIADKVGRSNRLVVGKYLNNMVLTGYIKRVRRGNPSKVYYLKDSLYN